MGVCQRNLPALFGAKRLTTWLVGRAYLAHVNLKEYHACPIGYVPVSIIYARLSEAYKIASGTFL